jgi:hypothetical protein
MEITSGIFALQYTVRLIEIGIFSKIIGLKSEINVRFRKINVTSLDYFYHNLPIKISPNIIYN